MVENSNSMHLITGAACGEGASEEQAYKGRASRVEKRRC